MTDDEALDFLYRNQPLPPEREWTDELIAELEQVLEHFSAHIDARCVRPLVFSMGFSGTGLGWLDGIVEVISKYSVAEVVPALRDAMSSPNENTQFHAIYAIDLIGDPNILRDLKVELRRAMSSPRDGIRWLASAAMQRTIAPSDRQWIAAALASATSEDESARYRKLLDALNDRTPT